MDEVMYSCIKITAFENVWTGLGVKYSQAPSDPYYMHAIQIFESL